MNFINKIQKLMYGRYGPDDLYKLFLGMYFILIVLDLFINSKVLTLLELLVFVIILYRFFSKNIYKRSDENQKYLKIKKKVLKPFLNIERNVKDKNHIYKKCLKCKTTLKLDLPNKRGIKHAKCPKCKSRVTLLALKRQKIEIISNKGRVNR